MAASDEAPVVPISVVISTLDRPQPLARCLDAVLGGTRRPTEIVIVDQGDASATDAVLQARRGSGTPLVHLRQPRRGLSASQNAGVGAARSPVVSIVDDDCVPDRRWLEAAAREHMASAGPLLLGGRVLALPSVGDRTVPLALRESPVGSDLSSSAMPWDLGTGGNFSVTRRAYLEVGGNDELLGTGTPGRAGNDLDLFRRLMRAGVGARYEPDMLVRHERATLAEVRNRSWTYGFGVGASITAWLWDGDRWALRCLVGWGKMRLRMLESAVRRRSQVIEEVRVLLGTAHGMLYGLRIGPGRPARGIRAASSPAPGSVGPSRLLRVARHPIRTGSRLWTHVTSTYRLPVGRVARLRRLLVQGLGQQQRVLVLGPAGAPRQAWPTARLDVVGNDPAIEEVSVVSEALDPGSLPRRWTVVVVTDAAPGTDRLVAATKACLPGGLLAVACSASETLALPQGTEVERVLRALDVRLTLARVPG